MTWIIDLFGEAVYQQFIICLGAFLEVLICCFLFNIKTIKKKKWLIFYLLWLVLLPVFALLFGFLRAYIDNLFFKGLFLSLTQSILLVIIIITTYQLSLYEKCLNFCAVSATYTLTGKLFSIALNAANVDDFVSISFFNDFNEIRDWLIYAIVHITLYFVFGFVFQEKNKISINRKTKINIISLSLITIVLINILFSISRIYEPESRSMAIISKVFACICCLIILVLRSGILYQSKKEQEIMVLNELFYQETKQFETLRSNIDLINSKCHDLRHQLNTFEGKLTTQEIEQLKEATRIYDSTIKTGYDVLDAIIYEKQLLCEKHQIRLNCLCDGNAVKFLQTTHLYSLLSNALNNAIEACKKLDEEHRIIGLSIKNSKGFTIIEVFNYCFEKLKFNNNIPVSTKDDKSHHGYGYKSMQYIASEYEGNLISSLNNNLFTLKIYLVSN